MNDNSLMVDFKDLANNNLQKKLDCIQSKVTKK